MNDMQIHATVLQVLREVAPDADVERLDPGRRLRDQLDYFDSMDCLDFVEGLHEAFAIDISELDYPRLATLAGCIDYLKARLDRR